MACKCIDELPAQIMAHCNQQKEYQAKPVLDASFKDIVFPISNGEMSVALKSDIELKVEGRKTPKKTIMTFTYCPFCGMKYKDDDSDLYYLQDSRSFNGNYMMFWGLEDKGYTSDIRKAQTYTLEDAEKRASNRETDIPRKVSDIKPLARHCFDGQDLRKIKQVNV